MRCDRAASLLPRMLDRELPWIAAFRLRRHVAACASCAAQFEEQQSMQAALRAQLTVYRAPAALAGRITAALPMEVPPPVVRPVWRIPTFSLAGTGLAGALAGAAFVLLLAGGNNPGVSVTEAVVDHHVASMMADHLTDVQTSNQHVVKPWLSQRVDVSPPATDFAADGFPLVGGRMDYIDGHAAAAVVYRHDRHIINLFVWASPGIADEQVRATSEQGFHVMRWRAGGLTYFAVSDVEPSLLAKFVRLVKSAAG